jgi:CheY-like chemotaxis protein
MKENTGDDFKFSHSTILLADDDSDDRKFAIDAFRQTGFTGKILEVENGKILLDKLQEMDGKLPDLLIIDLNMPHVNGYEAMERLNRDERLSTIPRVILTTSSQLQEMEKCKKLGCIAYYHKPTTLVEYDRIAAEIISLIKV